MKKLFISIFTAVFALFALGTSTFAWFSMNTQAKASGMEVKAIAGSSLQISNTTTFKSGQTSFNFEDGAYTVKPATQWIQNDHQSSVSTEPASHLVAVKNTGDIDPATGLAKLDEENNPLPLTYEAATTQSTVGENAVNGYYVDYVLNFAAEGTDTKITAGKLKLTIAPVAATVFQGEDPESDPVLKAVSIMVLYKKANASGDASLSSAGIIRLIQGTPSDETGYVICELSNDLYIPAAVAGSTEHADALQVILRVFVDGSLVEEGTDPAKTYVRNTAIVDLSKALGFSATFDLITE